MGARIKGGRQMQVQGVEGGLILAAGWLLLGGLCNQCPADTAPVLVMMGDSTTLCARNKEGHKLTELVQARLAELGRPVRVVNSGKGSDTAKGGYARLQQAVLDHDPDIVTLSFGLNDAGRLEPAEFRDWMDKIIQAVRQRTRARLLLVTSTPFLDTRHSWGARFEAEGGLDHRLNTLYCSAVRDLARQYALPVCDLHAHFKDRFAKEPALMDVLIMGDGVHLTDAGNRAAAEFLAPAIASLLGTPAKNASP